jgi:hypothetical protein
MNQLFVLFVLLFLGLTASASSENHVSSIANIHKKLSSNHEGKEFTSAVQSLIDRVLVRANATFQFHPILEIIDMAEVDGQLYDVFEIDSLNGKIVFR